MSDILRFYVKRVCILYAVELIICFFFKGQSLSMGIALTLSTAFALLRLKVLETVFTHFFSSVSKNQAIMINIGIYLLNLVIIGITIVLAIQFGIPTIIAALVGTLSTLVITMINAITEAFGITKNQYGQKVK